MVGPAVPGTWETEVEGQEFETSQSQMMITGKKWNTRTMYSNWFNYKNVLSTQWWAREMAKW